MYAAETKLEAQKEKQMKACETRMPRRVTNKPRRGRNRMSLLDIPKNSMKFWNWNRNAG